MSGAPARRHPPAPRALEHAVSDVLLPAQVYGAPQGFLSRTASARLMHAVLEQAIADLASPGGGKSWQQVAYRDAYWWIASGDVTHQFSFLNLCETLGYHAASVRAALLQRAPLPDVKPRRWRGLLRSAVGPG